MDGKVHVDQVYRCLPSPTHQLVCGPPTDYGDGCEAGNDRREPAVSLDECNEEGTFSIKPSVFYTYRNVLTGHMDVHTPKTSDQIHGDEHCTQCGQLRQNVVDLVVRVCHLNRDLSEVVGVRTRKNLFVVV